VRAALLLLGLVAGCERLPTGPAAVRGQPVRGVTFVNWTRDGYGSATADSAVAALAATGANTLVLVVTAYQSNSAASVLRADGPRTPSVSAVAHALTQASAAGLRVVLKPHVDLDDATWRGRIAPADPAAWFASYQAFVLPWAALAESVGARQFVIGTELAGTLRHRRLWSETIRKVRALYSGPIVYAASWDEAGQVPFWGDVDLVGVDFYFPVATRADPGRFEILAGWQRWLDRLRLLHHQTGRPILLTEIGYRSVAGAGMHPYQGGSAGALDLREQADLYWAALQACGDLSWLEGMYWWNWPADGSGGPDDVDYTPRGKPAAAELEASWKDHPSVPVTLHAAD